MTTFMRRGNLNPRIKAERKYVNPEKVLRQQLLELLSGGNAHMDFDEIIYDFPPEFINNKAPNMPTASGKFSNTCA